MDPVEAIILEPGTIGETTAVSKKQSKMEQLELVDSDDKADTVEEEVLAEAPKDRVKGSIYMQEFDEQCARLMRVDPNTDQSAELLTALRECDRRPLITTDLMATIKALELVAVTREQPMKRANARQKRRRNSEKA